MIMRNMRFVLLLMVLPIFSTLVISCSKKNVEPTDSISELVVWYTEEAGAKEFMDVLAKKFEERTGNKIKVNLVHYSVKDIVQQYQNASIAGTGPAIILVPSDMGGVFNVGSFIMPLETVFELNEYVPVAIDAVRDNGHVWGIPYTTGNHIMMFYNKSLVKSPPANLKDLVTFCDKFKETNSDKYCLATSAMEPYYFIPWYSGFGGWVMDNDKPTLNNEAMINAMKYVKNIMDKYSPNQCNPDCMDGLFKEGKLAMVTDGDWKIEAYKKELGENFGIAVLPYNSESGYNLQPMVSGKHFMINSRVKGDEKAKAIEFVKFITNPENQYAMYESIQLLPGNKIAFSKIENKADPMTRASLKQLKNGKPMPMTVKMKAVWEALNTQLNMFFSGKRSAEDSAKKMQMEADRISKDISNG